MFQLKDQACTGTSCVITFPCKKSCKEKELQGQSKFLKSNNENYFSGTEDVVTLLINAYLVTEMIITQVEFLKV